jgi:hypothetical protein
MQLSTHNGSTMHRILRTVCWPELERRLSLPLQRVCEIEVRIEQPRSC